MTSQLRRAIRSLDWRLSLNAVRVTHRTIKQQEHVKVSLPALTDIKHVLVVRLDGIGDMVLTTPFLRELRRNLPQAAITLVVRPSVRNLIELCPYTDKVLVFDYADSRHPLALLTILRAAHFKRRYFGAQQFDLAIVPRWDADPHFAAVVAVGSGARSRLGYSERASLEKAELTPGLDQLLTHVRGPGPVQHEARRNLDLIQLMGGPTIDERLELWLDDSDREFAKACLTTDDRQAPEFLLAVAPGAANLRGRWPVSRFVEVADWSLKTNGGGVVVVGGDSDRSMGEQLRRALGPRVINAAGRATLRETAAILRRCTLFVGNDSGPMHLAAASGLPVVEISCHPVKGAVDHDNSPLRFGPWCAQHAVVQPVAPLLPCTDACTAEVPHCIQTISVAEVIARLARHLPRPCEAGA